VPVPFATVLCSPLQRARRTAELAGFGDRLALDGDLVEWNYGAYEGLTTVEIQARVPGWLVFRDGCPDGESPGQVGERVDRVIARLRGGEGPSLVVAHGTTDDRSPADELMNPDWLARLVIDEQPRRA
jgi:probable phosphoglycerate mutase